MSAADNFRKASQILAEFSIKRDADGYLTLDIPVREPVHLPKSLVLEFKIIEPPLCSWCRAGRYIEHRCERCGEPHLAVRDDGLLQPFVLGGFEPPYRGTPRDPAEIQTSEV